MLLIPQIYLKNKRVAALEGQTSPLFQEDPIATAQAIKEAGAEAIHIVDLGIPPVGTSPHLPVIKKICGEVELAVYAEGAFKTTHSVEGYIGAGVEMVALGTIAYQQPAFLEELCKNFSGKIAAHIDIKGGHVTIPGYAVVANKTAIDYANQFAEKGVRHILYSDVDANNRIGDQNIKTLSEFCRGTMARVICTSEVASLADIERIAELDAPRLDGLVLSKSLYDGRIDLRGAIAAVNDIALARGNESTMTEM